MLASARCNHVEEGKNMESTEDTFNEVNKRIEELGQEDDEGERTDQSSSAGSCGRDVVSQSQEQKELVCVPS